MKSNLIKLPGLVDVHVHLREPGATYKEDFYTGTQAAVAGGYTQILDMPNNSPPTATPNDLEDKINLAQDKIWCDVGFNFGGTSLSTKYFKQVRRKVFGLKVYMNQTTGPLLIDKAADREVIFKLWNSPLPIMVHAEGKTVEAAIRLARKYRKKLHICHIAFDQIRAVNKAKSDGLDISSEVCPHHLFLNKSDLKRLGPQGVMKPPLLSKKDQEKLWLNLDKIDMISTDHAPHTLAEKYDHSSPKYGVPGLETTLPLMLNAVTQERISLERLIELACTNPRIIFSLPNQQETYVEIDTAKKYKISNKGLFTKCGWTPFVGMEGRGKVKKVVIRGQIVFENGRFAGNPQGKVIYPQP